MTELTVKTAQIVPAPQDRQALVMRAAHEACGRIAPLWPLKHFVAVNPFLGMADKSFTEAAHWLARVARADMLAPLDFYLRLVEEGAIASSDIEAALATGPRLTGVSNAADFLRVAKTQSARTPPAVVATVAEILDALADGDRQASRTAFMIEEISKWCAAYFDEGQASWTSPWRGMKPYAAWRSAMRHDRNPESMGVRHFRRTIAALPDTAEAAIFEIVSALEIPDRALGDYLFRALFDIQGWAAYARYRVWDNALHGRPDETLLELLAIRVAWGYALFKERTDEAFKTAWRAAMHAAGAEPADARMRDGELVIRCILQEAYDHANQRGLLQTLKAGGAEASAARPSVQAAFCIDVRSEIFRRALEAQAPDIETIGFAGFFGFPIEYVPIGQLRGGAQCPVLLKPSVIVCEAVKGAAGEEETEILGLRLMRRRAAKAWKAFKLSAVSSFAYVETIGLGFAAKIVSDALGLTRPVPDPSRDGLDGDIVERLGPRLEPAIVDGRVTGLAPEARLAMAETVLRAMSMTGRFARLVLLAGHGSASVNNPHASGLDCGACGGHTGEANARVAAAILNDPDVRIGLHARGIAIPADTYFLGALHNTTTDDVEIFDTETLPKSHADDLVALKQNLARAAALARRERAALLGIAPSGDVHGKVRARSRDWSQVRPEWGLAGNMAFIAATRARTRNASLSGRSFLHTYDWRGDKNFATLELIMTAPMVVASWINLQYFGSSVNNKAFGSGNKALHNVVGALGVLEGNGGDLRTGLPWQSVHDGSRFIHEPLRLNVIIEAPIAAINDVLARHEGVRALVENKWVHLFAIDDAGTLHRYWGGASWGSEGALARAA